ncbi:hypothetical protein HJC23_010738 [Cyclotella cryptica]|uniref:Helicase-associated domain-containing protein n=1 Tax=Cyclotella cryptica TaxID=29204 RepID=A0ABD3PV09_9STRA|eukprot:CCRYP_011064-RA/>CCRYP_011064-RA protein AED:0.04 eAED:0.04 QI:301/1/1/1/1/1/2/2022/579
MMAAITTRALGFLLTLRIINSACHHFYAEAFLDAIPFLDRIKTHCSKGHSWKITSFIHLDESFVASSLSRHSSMAYIEQRHKRRRRIKTCLPASVEKGNAKKSDDSPKSTATKTKNRHELLFQQRLLELKDFIAENGHGSIPTPYEANPPLGVWAANLRRQFVIREQAEHQSIPYKGYLTQERLSLLQRSGFDFTSLTERQFKMRLEELKDFKEKYGHTLVPEKYDENMALGAWVSNMRTLYRKRRSQSAAETKKKQQKVVDDNGIIKEKGNKNLLKQKISPSKRKRQRSQRLSHLDDEKEKMLDEVGFVWNAIDRKWFEMLEWAKVYAVVNFQLSSARVGNTSISLDAVGDAEDSFNRTDLDHRDSLLLKNYHTFVKNIQDQTLLPYFHPQDEILDLLLDENYTMSVLDRPQPSDPTAPSASLVTTTKSCVKSQSTPSLDYRVRTDDSLHYSLRIWMVNQRSNYHRRIQNEVSPSTAIPSTMTDQRQRALEEINFPWSGRFRNRWEEMQYEVEQEQKKRLELEKERKRKKKLQEEKERLEELKTSKNSASRVLSDSTLVEDDIMSLWGAEEEEDEDDW